MVMRRKLVYLSYVYSKEMVDAINLYFDKGYEIEDILNAEDGYYILLILKGNENYNNTSKYVLSNLKPNLIEENNQKWIKTNTADINLN
jgi:hypothetical protein